MDFSKLLPKPHPTKLVFKKSKLPLSAVANFIGRSYNHTTQILSGVIKATPSINKKLWDLAKSIDQKKGLKE